MTYSNALFSQVAITAFKTWGSLEKRKGENMSTPQTGQGETSEQIHHSEGRLHVQCKSLKMFLAFHLKLVVVTQTKRELSYKPPDIQKDVYISVHVYIHGGAVDVDEVHEYMHVYEYVHVCMWGGSCACVCMSMHTCMSHVRTCASTPSRAVSRNTYQQNWHSSLGKYTCS